MEAEALSVDAKWRKLCTETLAAVSKNRDAWIFQNPVIESPELSHEDKVAYSALIPEPMDFRTIRKNIASFESPLEFEYDMTLVFRNCMTFNKPGQDAFEMGKDVESFFLAKWQLERRREMALAFWQKIWNSPARSTATFSSLPESGRRLLRLCMMRKRDVWWTRAGDRRAPDRRRR